MTFDKDYTVILDRAKRNVERYEIDIEPEEVISNVYVNIFTNPEYIYDYFSFDKAVQFYCKYYKGNTPNFIPYTDKWKKSQQFIKFKLHKTCNTCKKVKSADEFRVMENKIGKKTQLHKCKECYTSWRKQYNIDNKEKARLQKEKRAAVLGDTALKLRAKKRNIKQLQAITDSYLKGALSHKYSTRYLNDHPEIIEEARQRILSKRRKKKINKIKDSKTLWFK